MDANREIILVFRIKDTHVLLGKVSLFALKVCKLNFNVRFKAFTRCLSWLVISSVIVTQVPISF